MSASERHFASHRIFCYPVPSFVESKRVIQLEPEDQDQGGHRSRPSATDEIETVTDLPTGLIPTGWCEALPPHAIGHSCCLSDGSIDMSTFFQIATLSMYGRQKPVTWEDVQHERTYSRTNIENSYHSSIVMLSGEKMDEQQSMEAIFCTPSYPMLDINQYQQLNYLLFRKTVQVQNEVNAKQDIGSSRVIRSNSDAEVDTPILRRKQIEMAEKDRPLLPTEIEMRVNDIDAITLGLILQNLAFGRTLDTLSYQRLIKTQFEAIKKKGSNQEVTVTEQPQRIRTASSTFGRLDSFKQATSKLLWKKKSSEVESKTSKGIPSRDNRKRFSLKPVFFKSEQENRAATIKQNNDDLRNEENLEVSRVRVLAFGKVAGNEAIFPEDRVTNTVTPPMALRSGSTKQFYSRAPTSSDGMEPLLRSRRSTERRDKTVTPTGGIWGFNNWRFGGRTEASGNQDSRAEEVKSTQTIAQFIQNEEARFVRRPTIIFT